MATAKKETKAPKPMQKGLQSKAKPVLKNKPQVETPKKEDEPIISEKVSPEEQKQNEIHLKDNVLEITIPEERVQKITEKIQVKYVFTQEEIGEKGIQLGRLHQNVEQIKDEIKEFVSMKKSQIEQSNTQINELSRHVTNGYTFIDEVCDVKLMDPEPGKKSYYKQDGTFVEIRSMMPMDYQAKIQFDTKQSQSDADDKAIAEMDNGKDRIRD